MTTCGYDAKDQLLPLAFGLLDRENNLACERFIKFVSREVVSSRGAYVYFLMDIHPF